MPNNQHQIGVALQMYTSDNRDNLPCLPANVSTTANSLWDIPDAVSDGLSGGTGSSTNFYKGIFYCPGSVLLLYQNLNYWWDYVGGGSDTHRVTSYQWMISRNGVLGSFGTSSSTAVTLAQPKGFLTKISTPFTNLYNPSTTEMVSDTVITSGTFTAGVSGQNATGQTYYQITSSNPTELPYGYNSSHMTGKMPAGGNILFMDCHVEWRNFKTMQMWGAWSNNRNNWF